jgi:predicted hotdog family 3-hydroxylacyl-ACP dehydratase
MTVQPVANLIPHGPPMRLIDRVLLSTPDSLWADVIPKPDSLFAGPAGVHAIIGLEYLAQASAAFFTLIDSPTDASSSGPRQGMLIACRQYHAQQPYFAIERRLLLRVSLDSSIQSAAAGHGLVKFRGEIFAAPDSMSVSPDSAELSNAARTEALTVASLSVYL